MKAKKILLSLLSIGILFTSFSQSYLGVHSSNYGGVMSTDFQPASFVDGRFLVDIQLAGFNLNTYQNGYYFDAKKAHSNGFKWWWKGFKSDQTGVNSSGFIAGGSNPNNDWIVPDSTFSDRYIGRDYDLNSDKTIGLFNSTQVDILNFAFHIKPNIAIGLMAKMRSYTNIDNISSKLAFLSEKGFDYQALWNLNLDEASLKMNHMTWAEVGFNYSQIVMDKNEHFLKVGGKVKWLQGLASVYLNAENVRYNLFNSDTTQFLQADVAYGFSNNFQSAANNQAPSNPIDPNSSKWGLGLDLGVVYEWRPNWKEYQYDMDGEKNLWRRSKEKYKLRAGLSILDIGGVMFKRGQTSSNFSVNTTQLFDLASFINVKSLSHFDNKVDSISQVNPDWTNKKDGKSTFFMNAPTSIGLSLDYHIWKIFYVNATGQINIISKKNEHAVRTPSQISITPSIDHEWVGAHFPMSYNKYSGFKAGVGLRLGPLTVGVTDFRTLFGRGKVRGAEIYAGLRIPILYREPVDSDNDKVSDKLDECVSVPGVWEFRGCPDTDGDGIQDTEDECPKVPGTKELKGCPDTDGDGIADIHDECPEVAGIKKFRGCPDTDGDGIADKDDKCPEVAGIPKFEGCPDTDGDGIQDSEDKCPELAGTIEGEGCPDTDGDGVYDHKDKCPTEPGVPENDGCPYSDTDGDGILDKDDKCPTVAGVPENDGCPKIEEEVKEIIQTAFDNLEFETGKDVIKQSSLPSLTELAKVLLKKKDWKLQISGHTDAIGSAQSNLLLSKKRSEAVKNFMIEKGISADRLTALYFGETQPIATNDTKEGRQKNRRVEMQIVFE